jgi:hypothetical protein
MWNKSPKWDIYQALLVMGVLPKKVKEHAIQMAPQWNNNPGMN